MGRWPRRVLLPLAVAIALLLTAASCSSTPAARASQLATCTRGTHPADRPTLASGDHGSCVGVLQRNLLYRGYSLGGFGATGIMNAPTVAAVKRFQQRHGLPVTGQVDRATWLRLGQGPAKPRAHYNVERGPNFSRYVVLSYDDCPPSYASFQRMVLAAQRANIALVLFPTGECLRSGRFNISYAHAHGSYVFNHTISHPNLTHLSTAAIKHQLGPPGVVTDVGRAPYGAGTLGRNPKVRNAYAALGMRMWYWSLDTRDWTGKSQAAVVNTVVRHTRAGDAVLMHMQWHAFNPTALAQMQRGLAAKGLSLCRNFPGMAPDRLRGDRLLC